MPWGVVGIMINGARVDYPEQWASQEEAQQAMNTIFRKMVPSNIELKVEEQNVRQDLFKSPIPTKLTGRR